MSILATKCLRNYPIYKLALRNSAIKRNEALFSSSSVLSARGIRKRILTTVNPEPSLNAENLEENWSNPMNLSVFPEELRYPIGEVSDKQKKLSDEIVSNINAAIREDECGRMFAIIQVQGQQFKVTNGDLIIITDVFHVADGETIKLPKVLALGCKDFTLLGRPVLDRTLVEVEATVVEKTLQATNVIFNFLKKTGLRHWRFYRKPLTILRINHVGLTRELNEEVELNTPKAAEGVKTFDKDGSVVEELFNPQVDLEERWYPKKPRGFE